jgi:hypothetical protein
MNTTLDFNKKQSQKARASHSSFAVSNFETKDVSVIKNNFNTAKVKLFKMLDEGINSKKNFIADSNFWKEFKKI